MGILTRALCALPVAAAILVSPAVAAVTISGSTVANGGGVASLAIPASQLGITGEGHWAINWTFSRSGSMDVEEYTYRERDEFLPGYGPTGEGNEYDYIEYIAQDIVGASRGFHFNIYNYRDWDYRPGYYQEWTLHPIEYYFNFDTAQSGPIDYSITARYVSAVPEPGSWALMIAGFGLLGAALRRRPSQAVAPGDAARA